jgi:hypothetical protein
VSQTAKDVLVGYWRIDPNDDAGRRAFGDVTLAFHPTGILEYICHETEKDGISILRYEVGDDFIETTQPSAPRVERTRFELTKTGELILESNGIRARYVRVPTPTAAAAPNLKH